MLQWNPPQRDIPGVSGRHNYVASARTPCDAVIEDPVTGQVSRLADGLKAGRQRLQVQLPRPQAAALPHKRQHATVR